MRVPWTIELKPWQVLPCEAYADAIASHVAAVCHLREILLAAVHSATRHHMDELTGSCAGLWSSEACLLRNLVSSSNAAELFLLLLPSADNKVRFDLERGSPPCWVGEAQGSRLLLAVVLEVAFTRLVRGGL